MRATLLAAAAALLFGWTGPAASQERSIVLAQAKSCQEQCASMGGVAPRQIPICVERCEQQRRAKGGKKK
jgi:hypothetical protein